MSSARSYPPSEQRIAEARASGHAPNAPLSGFAFAALALVASAFVLGPRAARSLRALLGAPLAQAASGDAAAAHASASACLRELAGLLALALVACYAGALLGRSLAQGPAFALFRRSARARFPGLRPSRTASALFCVGLCFASAGAIADAVWLTPEALSPLARSWAQRVIALSLACAAIDAAFARAHFFRSLWMTRREYLDEQRSAFGAPEVRAQRERLRRAGWDEAPAAREAAPAPREPALAPEPPRELGAGRREGM